SRRAQWRPCRLEAAPIREGVEWATGFREFWGESFDRLDAYLAKSAEPAEKATKETRERKKRRTGARKDEGHEQDEVHRGARQAGDHHGARVRCAARARLRRLHRSEGDRRVVGAAEADDEGRDARGAARRRLACRAEGRRGSYVRLPRRLPREPSSRALRP